MIGSYVKSSVKPLLRSYVKCYHIVKIIIIKEGERKLLEVIDVSGIYPVGFLSVYLSLTHQVVYIK